LPSFEMSAGSCCCIGRDTHDAEHARAGVERVESGVDALGGVSPVFLIVVIRTWLGPREQQRMFSTFPPQGGRHHGNPDVTLEGFVSSYVLLPDGMIHFDLAKGKANPSRAAVGDDSRPARLLPPSEREAKDRLTDGFTNTKMPCHIVVGVAGTTATRALLYTVPGLLGSS
jgi:hypothetical protein